MKQICSIFIEVLLKIDVYMTVLTGTVKGKVCIARMTNLNSTNLKYIEMTATGLPSCYVSASKAASLFHYECSAY